MMNPVRGSFRSVTLLALGMVVAGCATLPRVASPAPWSAVPPGVTVVVASDLHLLGPELVSEDGWARVESGAFQEFRRGPALVASFVQKTLEHPPNLVILAGDLTKEGERASHRTLAGLLVPLREAGIPVLVVPGNHDILNPGASSFTPQPRATPSVTPEEFAQIYGDFGYRQALSRDPASLSYLSEPVPGLRVLALDTARYEDHAGAGRQVTAGRIRGASWPWIEACLADAKNDGAVVVVVMHHGLVEKFPGQGGLLGDYLVDQRDQVARRLSAGGVELVLTGHFHSLSVAAAPGLPLVEVESGTLSQEPFGYRRLTFEPHRLAVSTEYLAGDGGSISGAVAGRLTRRLGQFGVSEDEARLIASGFARAFAAVEAGDPVRPEDWSWPPRGLGLMGSLAVAALGPLPEAFWTPYGPSDLNVSLPLPLALPEE